MINITILAFCFSAGSEKHFALCCTTEWLYHDNTMGDKLHYSCIVNQTIPAPLMEHCWTSWILFKSLSHYFSYIYLKCSNTNRNKNRKEYA